MKKFLAIGAIVTAALFSIQPATAADPVPVPVPTVEAPVTAPDDATLTNPEPAVTVQPSPEPDPIYTIQPVPIPGGPYVFGPDDFDEFLDLSGGNVHRAPEPEVPDYGPAPEKLPDAPVFVEVDPYSGNPIIDCEAQGLIRTEDYTCADPSYYPEPVTILEDDPRFDCTAMGNLLCGDARYEVAVQVESLLIPKCSDPGTVDPAVIRWCDWKANNP
jgi:hypothetical protein